MDTRTAKPGDEVTARVTQDVKSGGKVVVPRGSKLVGHVTEAGARTSESSESRLGIYFDHAVLKDGQQVAFGAVVQALAPPVDVAASAMNDDSVGMASNARSGGAARSSGGGVVGGTTSAVGGTVGAVGNTAGSVAGSTTSAVGGAVNSTTGVAGRGVLNSTSHGVIGLQGRSLSSATSGDAQASVITCTTQNVKLDNGTQMLLQIQC